MLSLAKLGAGGQRYYLDQAQGRVDHRESVASGVEDYYLAAPEAHGRWMGAEAERLGLAGREVQEETLHRALLVFGHPHSGRPYDASKMRERFKAALARAGLRPLRFHDLRHTYGTLMAAAGAPLRTLQGWMGHRYYKTTEVYADFAPNPSQGAAWAERAFGAANPELGEAVEREPWNDKSRPVGGS